MTISPVVTVTEIRGSVEARARSLALPHTGETRAVH